jgi:drug/metabolite transporter (DMT)-like permease
MSGQNTHVWKGYVWALAGTVAFSCLYVFSKAGLNQVHLAQFGLYYFGIGFLLNLLLILVSGKISQVFSLPAKIIRLLVILAVIDLASNITFFMAIRAIADPSVTSFLGNLFPVFLATLSIIFLKERFTLLEALGALLAISGAFVISFSGDPDWRKFFIPGTGLVVMNTLLAAIFSMIVKKNIQKVSPEIFNLNSNGWIFLSFLVYFIWSGKPLAIPQSAFLNILASAFFGAFFALLSFYYSYKFIPASRSSIVQSLKGVFVLIIAFFYFGSLPVAFQLLGGAITVAGVLIMTLSQAGFIRIGKAKD